MHPNMADHRIAPKGDRELFWRRSNWQPFNVACNSARPLLAKEGLDVLFGRQGHELLLTLLGKHHAAPFGYPSEPLADQRTDRRVQRVCLRLAPDGPQRRYLVAQ